MMKEGTLRHTQETNFNIHPIKFTMWLFIATVVMLFAAFTSAYIVRRAEGNWLHFELPPEFLWSSLIVALGSVFMQIAYFSAKKDRIFRLRAFLLLTLLTGFVFLVNQYLAWEALVENGVFFVGNPASSFVYVISGMHGLHIVAALIYLVVTIIAAYRYRIHSRNMLQINLATTFWHFLGGLWIYLFIFLSMYR